MTFQYRRTLQPTEPHQPWLVWSFCLIFFLSPSRDRERGHRVTSYLRECVVELNSGDSGSRTPMSPNPHYVGKEVLSHPTDHLGDQMRRY